MFKVENILNQIENNRDIIDVSGERLDIKNFMGWRYSLPDPYINAQSRLPDNYDLNRLNLIDYTKLGTRIYWPEVEMSLQLSKMYTPISWKLIQRLVCDSDCLPMTWIDHIVGGGEIIFPHAMCHRRNKNGLDYSVRVAIDYNKEEKNIQCYGINPWEIKPDIRIAVYQ